MSFWIFGSDSAAEYQAFDSVCFGTVKKIATILGNASTGLQKLLIGRLLSEICILDGNQHYKVPFQCLMLVRTVQLVNGNTY